MTLLVRLLKVWIAAGLTAYGLTGIFRAFRLVDLTEATVTFFVGLFFVLATIPLWPWLAVRPARFVRSYWRDRDE